MTTIICTTPIPAPVKSEPGSFTNSFDNGLIKLGKILLTTEGDTGWMTLARTASLVRRYWKRLPWLEGSSAKILKERLEGYEFRSCAGLEAEGVSVSWKFDKINDTQRLVARIKFKRDYSEWRPTQP